MRLALLLLLATTTTAVAQDHRGGVLRMLAQTAAGSVDPQINYTAQMWQIFVMAYDGLVAFRKTSGEAGNEIVPDLADALPQPTDDGLTYAFHLRPGLRFSDGSPVRPADAAASLRRIFRVSSPTAGSFYGAIEGADACLANPAACTLPGVRSDDAAGTVTIHLSRPDPELLLKLALPHASVVPEASPGHDAGTAPLPGTGPYRIDSYDPAQALRLIRNPFFHAWSADAQPDGFPDVIEERFGLEDEAEVTQVENGQADWMFDTPPSDRLGELGARFASQVHLNPALAIWLMPLNVNEPPFDDVRVRRALNFALDRAALAKLFGGPRLAVPTCQTLPPRLPGYVLYCPYTRNPGPAWSAPDPAQARALVAASGTAGQRVTLVTDTSTIQRAIGTYVIGVLRDLGYDARLRALSGNVQFTYIQNTNNHVQISLTTWYSDYPSAFDFLAVLYGCASLHKGSDSSINMSSLCDPALDAQMAAALNTADVDERSRRWAAVDRAVTDLAPAAVLFNPNYIDVTSRRVGHFTYHDQYHWLPDQSWVQ